MLCRALAGKPGDEIDIDVFALVAGVFEMPDGLFEVSLRHFGTSFPDYVLIHGFLAEIDAT